MLLAKSPSKRYVYILMAGLLLALLGLFGFTSAADAWSGSCSNWQGAYWSNRDLNGSPTLVRCDEAIDFNWKGLSPDVSIPVDNFSARWTRAYQFAPGNYRFSATMDDGMRVYLNGRAIIDDWYEGNVRTVEADIYVSGGTQNITVEYFEKGGNAVAGFTWSAMDGQTMPPGHPMPPPGQPMPQPPQVRPPQVLPPGTGNNPNVSYPVAEVMAYYLNVRSGPGVDNNVVAVLHRNDQVLLVARDTGGRWVLIRKDGLQGWVNRYYLHTDFPYTSLPFVGSGQQPPSQPNPASPQTNAVVNVSSLNVRLGPGVQYRAIAVVNGGTGVNVISREANGWVQIQIPGSVTGWVNGSYLTLR
ncbi:MAG: SH3 domain-containing protein [Candidatus Promineifilaceae bacterium]